MHLIGVFIYGGLTLCGLFAFAAIQGSMVGMGLAIVSSAFAWVAQNCHANEQVNVGNATAAGALISGIGSLVVSVGGF